MKSAINVPLEVVSSYSVPAGTSTPLTATTVSLPSGARHGFMTVGVGESFTSGVVDAYAVGGLDGTNYLYTAMTQGFGGPPLVQYNQSEWNGGLTEFQILIKNTDTIDHTVTVWVLFS